MYRVKILLLVLCSVVLSTISALERSETFSTISAAPPLIFNGDTLPKNTDFKKSQCGTLKTSATISEVSGIACSRLTPGYIWMESDDYRNVIATDEKGKTRYMKLLFRGLPDRWDWEDMCGGVYEGVNYLFVGAFGDNNETTGNYYIIYFEEPEVISSQTYIVDASYIHFAYPDGKKHNAEALMYDNREQMLYVITKVYYDVCQVFSLPMSHDYGEEEQTLTYICDLGLKSDLGSDGMHGFHLVTAADISPDGRYILIKNHNNNIASYSYVLLWQREADESVSEALMRQPEQIGCYSYEWQGEAMCWLDSTTFYTTSDEDSGDPPIFKYVKTPPSAVEEVEALEDDNAWIKLLFHKGNLYIRKNNRLYSLDGREV